jgi:hypothetical protein
MFMHKFINRAILYAPPTEGGGIEVEAGTGGESTAEPGIPAGFTKSQWENLLPAERVAFGITDEQIEAAEGGELEEDELDDALGEIGEIKEGEETPEQKAAADKAEADRIAALSPEDKEKEEAAKAAVAEVIPTDEELLSLRINIPDSDIPLPKVEVEVPKELADKIVALKAKRKEVNDWFDEGEKPDKTEFTKKDLRDALDEIDDETATINQEIAELRMEARISQRDVQKENAIWMAEQKAFVAATPEYREKDAEGKITDKSAMLFSAFASRVNVLLKDPANAGKSGMLIQIEADRAVRKAFNLPARGKTTPLATQVVNGKKTPKAPAATVPASVVNLGELPAAGEHDADPFANIDRIKDPVEREEALARMTPQQEAAYLKGART